MEARAPESLAETTAPTAEAPARRRPPLGAFALDVLIALGVMLAGSLAGGIAWGAWRGLEMVREGQGFDPARVGQPGMVALLWIAVAGTAGAALAVYFLRRRADTRERTLSWQRARLPATWGWIALTGVAVFLVSAAVNWLAQSLGDEVSPTNVAILKGVAEHQPWAFWLVAVGLAPAYEELLFRRVLFGRLWAAGYPVLGAVLSAALFALLHEIPGQGGKPFAQTLVLWCDYGAMGLAFAWVYRRTGTLWAAVGAHALNNALAAALLFWAT